MPVPQPDDRYSIGKRLRQCAPGVILTTEAGWLPYYAEWGSIDAVGLTDAYIRDNGITDEYLDRYAPDVIMWHCYNGSTQAIRAWRAGVPLTAADWGGTPYWGAIVARLNEYALSRGYHLIAITNTAADCRWWLLRENRQDYILALTSLNYPYVARVEAK